jgi:hypothetical protein
MPIRSAFDFVTLFLAIGDEFGVFLTAGPVDQTRRLPHGAALISPFFDRIPAIRKMPKGRLENDGQ